MKRVTHLLLGLLGFLAGTSVNSEALDEWFPEYDGEGALIYVLHERGSGTPFLISTLDSTWRNKGVIFGMERGYTFMAHSPSMQHFLKANRLSRIRLAVGGQQFLISIEDHSCDGTSLGKCSFPRFKQGSANELKAALAQVRAPSEITIEGISGYQGSGDVVFTVLADRMERVQWRPKVAATASASAATPVSARAPKPAAPKDPLAAHCARNGRGLYDCDCVSKRGDALRLQYQAGTNPEQQERVKHMQERIARQEKRCQNPESYQHLEEGSQAYKQTVENCYRSLERMQSRMNKAAGGSEVSVDELFQQITQGNACKVADELARRTTTDCLASSGVRGKVADPDTFCGCVGQKVGDEWLATDSQYSSRWVTSQTSYARQSCAAGATAATVSTKPASSAPRSPKVVHSPSKVTPEPVKKSESEASDNPLDGLGQAGSEMGAKAKEEIGKAASALEKGFRSLFK